jgi:N-acyl homoserine lactone hydrolase
MARYRIGRRTLLIAGIAAPLTAVGVGSLSDPPDIADAPPVPKAQIINLAAGIRVIAIQTGWVAVKRAHRQFTGPVALRFPAILADPVWTEWMPILAWVIDHPEGMIAIDTGETAQITVPGYSACDTSTGWFYGRNLRMAQRPEDEIGPQLTAFGIDPARIRRVVMTHLHSDHMGGMRWFPGAQFLVSSLDADGHQGALMCRLPHDINVQPVTPEARAAGVFRDSVALTTDGAVAIVPTPGHTPGHQSVLVQAGGRAWLFGGDAAFGLAQVENDILAGIVERPTEARATLAAIRAQIKEMPTVAVFAHDATSLMRLQNDG